MTFLCVIFVSPVYFAVRRNWRAFALNAMLYGFACVLLISIIGQAFASIFWALAVGHAGWHLKKELMTQQGELIATEMSEHPRESPSPPSLPIPGKLKSK